MLKTIFSYLVAVFQVVQILNGGGFAAEPEDNGVIDVIFDFRNGSEPYSFVAEAGSLITQPEEPQNRGLVFVGWYNGKTEWDFEKDTVYEDVTLTAKWDFTDNFYENDPSAGVRAETSDIRIMSFNVLLQVTGAINQRLKAEMIFFVMLFQGILLMLSVCRRSMQNGMRHSVKSSVHINL